MFFLEIVLYFKRNIYLFIWVCVKFGACLKGVGSLGDQIQAVRFGGKHLFLLNHLTAPGSGFQFRK